MEGEKKKRDVYLLVVCLNKRSRGSFSSMTAVDPIRRRVYQKVLSWLDSQGSEGKVCVVVYPSSGTLSTCAQTGVIDAVYSKARSTGSLPIGVAGFAGIEMAAIITDAQAYKVFPRLPPTGTMYAVTSGMPSESEITMHIQGKFTFLIAATSSPLRSVRESMNMLREASRVTVDILAVSQAESNDDDDSSGGSSEDSSDSSDDVVMADAFAAKVPAVTTDDDKPHEWFKCPVCDDIPPPPWHACSAGHILCLSCHTQLAMPKKCPQCRALMPITSEQRILEKVLTHYKVPLMFPCNNTGCDTMVAWDALDEHGRQCSYRSYPCPYHRGCQWRSSDTSMGEHLIKAHKVISVDEPTLWIHSSMIGKGSVHWWIPTLNIWIKCTEQNENDGTLTFFFYTLARDHVLLRVRANAPSYQYESDSTFRAPSRLHHGTQSLDALVINEHCMNMLRCPMNKTTELTLHLSLVGPSRKRPLEDADATDERDAKRNKVDVNEKDT